MKITREEALAIMRYSIQHSDYKFPLTLMNFEYGKDNPCDNEWCEEECKCFTGIDLTDDWDTLVNDKEYKTFEVRGDWSETDEDEKRIRAEELKKFDVYPRYACQHCGSQNKRVETLIDDEAFWNEDLEDWKGGFQFNWFRDNFSHTGNERCCECYEDWTGAE